MLGFLANVIEQLDVALEHLTKCDANNARFGLMLTDNIVELMLHQIAKDKKNELKMFSYMREEFKHTAALEKALGRPFESKVKFAKVLGTFLDEIAESISILHSLRNEVYHVGVQHEAVLPTLAIFYFKIACDFLRNYSPQGLGWGSNQRLPERAKKFFSGHSSFPGDYRAISIGMREPWRGGRSRSVVNRGGSLPAYGDGGRAAGCLHRSNRNWRTVPDLS